MSNPLNGILGSSGGGSGGSGDVVGPASSTDNAIARFDGATGKLLQDSSVLVPDGLSGTVVVGSTGATDGAVLIASGTGGGTLTAANGIRVTGGTNLEVNSGILSLSNASGPRIETQGVRIPSGGGLRWTNAANNYSDSDTGLARSAAGVVKVTDGSTGYGDLIADSLTGGTASTDLELIPVSSQCVKVSGTALWVNGPGSPKGDVWLGLYTGISAPADNVARITHGSQAGIGFLQYAVLVEANTAGSGTPNAIGAVESGTVFTNEGVTAKNYHTLPTAVAGYQYTFIVQDADGIRITANTDDTIRVIDKVTAAAGYIESTTIGSTVTLVSINAVEWYAVAVNGVWTDGTFTYDDTSLTTP